MIFLLMNLNAFKGFGEIEGSDEFSKELFFEEFREVLFVFRGELGLEEKNSFYASTHYSIN